MGKKKYYQRKWFAILLLFLFAPVGIFLIYKYGHFKRKTNLVLSVIFGLFFLSVVINGGVAEVTTSEVPKEKADSSSVEVIKNEEEIKTKKSKPKQEVKIKKEQYDVVWGTYDKEWVYSDAWTMEGFNSFEDGLATLDKCSTDSENETEQCIYNELKKRLSK